MGDWVIQTIAIFLKVDIEGSELTALPQWIESGALDKVTFIFCSIFQWFLDPGGATCYGASPAANTPTEKVFQTKDLFPRKAPLICLWQVSVAAESATAAVHLGVPSHQPRSEHDGEQIHPHISSACVRHIVHLVSGEEPICYQGVPRLPRGRPHERLRLELS